MGVQTAISLEEYLHTSYHGLDREFRDGEVVERTMPGLFTWRMPVASGNLLHGPERAA